MSSEQRRHARYSVEVAAEVEIGAEVLVASTMNISSGGVGIVSDRSLEEGSSVNVMLFLTQDGIEDPDEEPFEAPAKVMWAAEQEPGKHVSGLRFDDITGEQKGQLQRFLAALGE